VLIRRKISKRDPHAQVSFLEVLIGLGWNEV
jgi:hypothetical protein